MINRSIYFFLQIGIFHLKSGTFPFNNLKHMGILLSSYINFQKNSLLRLAAHLP